jgi:hypothetical protein
MASGPRVLGAQVPGELVCIARALPDPVDRYWTMVYTRVAELPATVPGWRVHPVHRRDACCVSDRRRRHGARRHRRADVPCGAATPDMIAR